MPNYPRPRVTGACVFFAVNLAKRGSWVLVEEVTLLREAVQVTKAERPFHVDA